MNNADNTNIININLVSSLDSCSLNANSLTILDVFICMNNELVIILKNNNIVFKIIIVLKYLIF
jgi:hypothetical protein